MKTKKALDGLLGLFGSFAAFLLGFLPVFVAAPPFTASLPPMFERKKNKKTNKKINTVNNLFLDLSPYQPLIQALNNIRKKKFTQKLDLLGVGFLRIGFSPFHDETCNF